MHKQDKLINRKKDVTVYKTLQHSAQIYQTLQCKILPTDEQAQNIVVVNKVGGKFQ